MSEDKGSESTAGQEPLIQDFYSDLKRLLKTDDSLEIVKGKIKRKSSLKKTDAELLLKSSDIPGIGQIAGIVRSTKNADITKVIKNVAVNVAEGQNCSMLFAAIGHVANVIPSDKILSKEQIIGLLDKEDLSSYDEITIPPFVNKEFSLSDYSDIIKEVKSRAGNAQVSGLSLAHAMRIAEMSSVQRSQVFKAFKDSGLDTIFSGGFPIISKEHKGDTIEKGEWASLMQQASETGLKVNVHFMFGAVEKYGRLQEAFSALNELQQKLGCISSFSAVAYLNDKLSSHKDVYKPSVIEMLKVTAASRILLENVDSIRVYSQAMGMKFTQLSQFFGADSFSTLCAEDDMNLSRLIQQAGFTLSADS